jgi:hypothetical protein
MNAAGSVSGQATYTPAADVPVRATQKQTPTSHSVNSIAALELLTCHVNYTATSVQLPQPVLPQHIVCRSAGFVAVVKQLYWQTSAAESVPVELVKQLIRQAPAAESAPVELAKQFNWQAPAAESAPVELMEQLDRQAPLAESVPDKHALLEQPATLQKNSSSMQQPLGYGPPPGNLLCNASTHQPAGSNTARTNSSIAATAASKADHVPVQQPSTGRGWYRGLSLTKRLEWQVRVRWCSISNVLHKFINCFAVHNTVESRRVFRHQPPASCTKLSASKC